MPKQNTQNTVVRIQGVSCDPDRINVRKELEKSLKVCQNGSPVEILFEGPYMETPLVWIIGVLDIRVTSFNCSIRAAFASACLREPRIIAEFAMEPAAADTSTGRLTGL